MHAPNKTPPDNPDKTKMPPAETRHPQHPRRHTPKPPKYETRLAGGPVRARHRRIIHPAPNGHAEVAGQAAREPRRARRDDRGELCEMLS